ncbi:MAG: ABC transporter ATP-binding protein [Actinomycetota bacterium]
MLRAEGIVKSYGEVQALRGADLGVEAGEVVSLLGRNGAGKTTLLSTIAGLLEPDAGTITVDGIDVWDEPKRAAALVGIAPQETGIYRAVSVRDNLRFFGELAGLRGQALTRRVDDLAEQLTLTALLDRKSTQLSGGEARRLHTACALVHQPKLLLLDEPTVGADVATRNELIEVVRQLAEAGSAVIYTTHYLPEVEALDADIVIIDQGAVLARGSQAELIDEWRTSGVEVGFDRAVDEASATQHGAEALTSTSWRIDAGGIDEAVTRITASGEIDALVVSAEFIRPNLERVFLNVTGSSLDDDAGSDGTEAQAEAGA